MNSRLIYEQCYSAFVKSEWKANFCLFSSLSCIGVPPPSPTWYLVVLPYP